MKEDKSGSKHTTPANDAPVDANVEKGTIADTRRAPGIDPARVPETPPDYKDLDRSTILALSKLGEKMDAELALAASQVIDKGPTLQTRFGELAPDTSAFTGLWKRYLDARAVNAAAQKLANYSSDIMLVARNDVLQIISLVDEAVRPAANRNAKLAEEFSAVLTISDQRSATTQEGKARVKAEKKATADAVAAAGGEATGAKTDAEKPPTK